ncbi:HEPN domain-containing protein [Prevotella sp. P6B4]|uniref:HEPN domain-containing protein n=1 Tax=Prevotella sp. P6B4 TaxID=1410614 RepID=UPI00048D6307|nr:HEPN domain-containing protein [Prevotella sp. P6B4]
MNKTLTEKQRISIVRYRMENAESTFAEVETHRANGFYNTAVNRLYYACYYAATAILIANGIEVKSHDGVRMNLGKYIVQEGILSPELGRYFSRLFSKRSTGDYDDFFNHSAETVDELMPDAKLFIQTIKDWTDKWLIEQEH